MCCWRASRVDHSTRNFTTSGVKSARKTPGEGLKSTPGARRTASAMAERISSSGRTLRTSRSYSQLRKAVSLQSWRDQLRSAEALVNGVSTG